MLDGWIALDRGARVPLAEQIYRQIRDAVRTGRIAPNTLFPSSRSLAQRLGVSRNTVTAAYELLQGEAIICVTAGAAPRSRGQASALPVAAASRAETRLSALGTLMARDRNESVYHGSNGRLRPGQPDVSLFPKDLWARSLRRAARMLPDRSLLYDHAEGLPALRTILSLYLAEARGVTVAPEHLHIVPTIQSALAMLGACLADPGDTIWIEDPGYLGARAAFGAARLAPMPVDADGANPAAMAGTPRLIYTTPSHQYPTGVRMSLPRRLALLESARRHGAIVLEDDYDSEFLWHGRPIPALQALSTAGEVIYLGTVAKSLLPGLRLAWLAAPPALSAKLVAIQRNLGLLANVHAQAAFADLIDGGHYRTHLNRISTIYEARADALVAAIAARCGDAVTMAPSHGGLQSLARFDPSVDDRAVARRLHADGFSVPFLSGLCLGERQSGLVIGFGDARAADADRFAGALARALASPA